LKQSEKTALYEAMVDLDGIDIDTALIQQPQCFYEVCSLLADAKLEKRDCEVSLKRLEGQIGKRTRSKYESRDNYATDSCINGLVDSDDKVKILRKKYNRLCVEVDKLDGLKEAYRQRSFSLNALAGRNTETEYMPDSVSSKPRKRTKVKRNKILRSI